MVELLRDLGVRVRALAQHGFHLRLVGLPDDDAEVGGCQVDVEKSHPRVRDEGVLDVGELELEEWDCHGQLPAGMFWRFAPEPKGLAEEEKRKVSVPAMEKEQRIRPSMSSLAMT